MRPKDLLQRAERLMARREPHGWVTLLLDEPLGDSCWISVDLDAIPPGPERDAVAEEAFYWEGCPTHEEWVELMLREDEEEARRANS